MTPEESRAWRPSLEGWSEDILPWIRDIAPTLPKPARIVEVGAFKGRALVFWGEELRRLGHGASTRIVGVDAIFPRAAVPQYAVPEGENHPDLHRNIAATKSDWEPVTIDLMLLESVVAAKTFEDESIDLCFIDASHDEASVRLDIEAWTRTVKRGGILAGHDYGAKQWPGVKQAVDGLVDAVCVTRSVWSSRRGVHS